MPGIVFLSGGQTAQAATAHLNAINRLPGAKPWKIGQQALHHRARCNSAASLGRFTEGMETMRTGPETVAHR